MAKRGPKEKLRSIDLKVLEQHASIGSTAAEIAESFGVGVVTFNTYRKAHPEAQEAFARGRTKLKQNIRVWQLKAAQAGNAAILIWLGKQELGQIDMRGHQITGKGGGPIQVRTGSKFSAMSEEQLAQALENTLRALRPAQMVEVIDASAPLAIATGDKATDG